MCPWNVFHVFFTLVKDVMPAYSLCWYVHSTFISRQKPGQCWGCRGAVQADSGSLWCAERSAGESLVRTDVFQQRVLPDSQCLHWFMYKLCGFSMSEFDASFSFCVAGMTTTGRLCWKEDWVEIMKMTALTCYSTSQSPATLATEMTTRLVFVVVCAKIVVLITHKWSYQTFNQLFSLFFKQGRVMRLSNDR